MVESVTAQWPRPLRRTHREQLFRFQTHALTDYLHHWDDGECGGISRHAEWKELLCPLCLRFGRLADLDEDHSPQNGGQSRLGSRHLTVLTCRPCNQRAGHGYERTAAVQRATLRPPGTGFCEIHNRAAMWTHSGTGLLIPVDYCAFDLTDVKAAYQLAFAALGYSWVLTPRLDELRAAFADRRPSSDYVIADAHPGDGLDPYSVSEVTAPVPCVVVKADSVRICLPARLSPPGLASQFQRLEGTAGSDVFAARGLRSTVRGYAWPQSTIGPGRTPEKTWDHSHFFAVDRCDAADHEHPTRTPLSEVTAFAA